VPLGSPGQEEGMRAPSTPRSAANWVVPTSSLLPPCIPHRKPPAPFLVPQPPLTGNRGSWLGGLRRIREPPLLRE
jgi:hypothetical protein